MTAPTIDIMLVKGKTFEYAFLYADTVLAYKDISAMPSKAPVRLTALGHGLKDGWPVHICEVASPKELNTITSDELREAAMSGKPLPASWLFARVVDADTVEFNALAALGWKAYSSGGMLICNAPIDLTDWSARAQVRDRVGGTLLMAWSSSPTGDEQVLQVDVGRGAFVLTCSAAATAALTWSRGVWELEATSPSGEVFQVVAPSKATVSAEVAL